MSEVKERGLAEGKPCAECGTAFCRHRPFMKSYGPRYSRRSTPAESGNRTQAQQRVNYLVQCGVLPRPQWLPCADCGQRWNPGLPLHQYDHYAGYAAEDHERVEVVCRPCHQQRTNERRAAA